MIRVVVFVRDMIIALALGWIGVTIQPATHDEGACALKSDAGLCNARTTDRGG